MNRIGIIYDVSVIAQGMQDAKCRTGIYWVAASLLGALAKRSDVVLYAYCDETQREYILQYLSQNFQGLSSIRILFRQKGTGRLQLPSGIAAYFSPLTEAPAEIKACLGIRRYSIVYDLIGIRHREYAPVTGDNWWLPQLLKGFDGDDFIFAVSEATKKDFLDFRPDLDPACVRILHLAADDKRFRPCQDASFIRSVRRKYGIPNDKKYVFSLCTIEPRKNLLHTLKCFLRFVRENHVEDEILVLGGTKWDAFQERFERELASYGDLIAKYVRQIGYVADEDLPVLYSGAEYLPYMSLYEGFGLPPLEAMQCGCPVVTSNTTSLPEVIGDACPMLRPDDEDGLVAVMKSFYFMTAEQRKELQNRVIARASQFSWDKAAELVVSSVRDDAHRFDSCAVTNGPRVSVITIVYNLVKCGRVRTFLQMVESVRLQSYGNVEHLVVDGGSKDGTIGLLDHCREKGWIKYVSEPDHGIYDAMNKGARMASGKYIAFLNSDDYWHDPHAIEASVDALERMAADFSYAQALVLDGDRPSYLAPMSLGTFFVRMPFCHQTMFTRRDRFLTLGGFRDRLFRSAADFDFILRLCLSGAKPVYVPLNFTSYRLGGLSAVQQTSSETEAQRAIRDALSKFDPEFNLGDAAQLYYDKQLGDKLYQALLRQVCQELACKMELAIDSSADESGCRTFRIAGEECVALTSTSLQGFAWRKRPSLSVRWMSRKWGAVPVDKTAKPEKSGKKRLLYIGHSYHGKTGSTRFLQDLLAERYDVYSCALNPDIDSGYDELCKLTVKHFDVCVIFQLMPSIRRLRRYVSFRHGVFFPMYDYYQPNMPVSKSVWREYRDFRIVNFCRAVHDELSACGFDSKYIQYFIEPQKISNEGNVRSVFFWERINPINLELLARLLGKYDVDAMHIHRVSDPGHRAHPVPKDESQAARFYSHVHVTESSWYERGDGMKLDMEKSALYIAPRCYEGIGMSFLEAMAMGRCVIAPDVPTMNEYIENGVNGILYPFDLQTATSNAEPLDLSEEQIRVIQENAAKTAKDGYKKWVQQRVQLFDWMEAPIVADRKKLDETARHYQWDDEYDSGGLLSRLIPGARRRILSVGHMTQDQEGRYVLEHESGTGLDGLYARESWGGWCGKCLDITVKLPEELRRKKLYAWFEMGAYRPEDADSPTVTLSVGGKVVGRQRIENVMPRAHCFAIESKFVKGRLLSLHLETDRTCCPKQLGSGSDVRELGISFRLMGLSLFDRGDPLASASAGASDVRLLGLYEAEPWGAWAGRKIQFRGGLPQRLLGKDLFLRVRLGAFHLGDAVPLLVVKANGHEVGVLEVPNIMPEPYELRIPAEAVAVTPLDLELISSVSHNPKEEGFGTDSRELGLSFAGLEFATAEDRADGVRSLEILSADDAVTGLYNAESWGAWGSERVRVRVSLPKELWGHELSARILAGSLDCQPIAVTVAGKELTRYTPSKAIPDEPHGCVIAGKYTAAGKFDLILSVEHAVVPKERGLGTDPRRLGVSFVKVELKSSAESA